MKTKDRAYALSAGESEALLADVWVREAEAFRLGVLTGRGAPYAPPYVETPDGLKLLARG